MAIKQRYNPLTLAAAEVVRTCGIDESRLYDVFATSIEDTRKLESKAIHKALNLPMAEDVNINQSRTGISGPWLATALAAVGVPALATAAYLAYQLAGSNAPETPPAAPTGEGAVKVQLYYDDPVKGLVPIQGAADQAGGEIPTGT